VASILCFYAISLKSKLGYDDTLDVFGIHGVAGITGATLLTFFIRPSWMADASAAAGGVWTTMDQLLVQLTAVVITIVYAAVVTGLLIVVVNKLVGFRLDRKDEMAGMDHSLHSERGYGMLDLN
jgi:Amt family ammonium transporter